MEVIASEDDVAEQSGRMRGGGDGLDVEQVPHVTVSRPTAWQRFVARGFAHVRCRLTLDVSAMVGRSEREEAVR